MSATRSRFASLMDEQLFAAWQTGDPAAQQAAWARLWTGVLSFAVALCGSFAPDDHAAEAWASDAVNQAYLDVQRRLQAGLRWEGEAQFTGLFVDYVKHRCRDRCRAFARIASRTDSGAAEEDNGRPFEEMVSVPPEAHTIWRTKEAVEDLIARLERRRTICHGRKALLAVIDAMQAYVRQAVDASSEEMSEFIMARLQISRNVLDLRQREIRKLEKQAAVAGAGDAPGPGTL